MKILPLLVGALLSSTLNACTTVGRMKNLPLSEGITLIAEAPLQRTLIFAKDAVVACGLNLEDEVSHDANWVIVADKGMFNVTLLFGAFFTPLFLVNSYGHRGRVVGEANNDEQTLIRVLVKPKWFMGIDLTSNFEEYKKCIAQTIELKAVKEKGLASH